MNFLHYLMEARSQIAFLFLEHIQLTIIAVLLAIAVGVPLGIIISYVRNLCRPVLGAVNLIQAIPSLALLGMAIPLLGIGKVSAIIVVMLYSLLPIVKNTFTGLGNINPQTLEAAKGIGLTKFQVLTKVQIPLALPIIMAGVRIAAVTAVGLMTIAAFIGAGGLGYLVFSGISTVNNNLILAGAIPACILALFVDFLVGQIEVKVTPKQRTVPGGSKGKKAVSRFAMGVAALLAIFVIGYTAYMQFQGSHQKIVVGGKDYTEQHVVTHMLAEYLDHHLDVAVERKVNLGGTQVCFNALRSGDLDIYVEYTGTAYTEMLAYPAHSDMQLVYDTVKRDFGEKFGLVVLQQMGWNNTYTLATTKEIAERYGLKTIKDLTPVASSLKSGCTFEFLNREDGMPSLEKAYNFQFKDNKAINGSQRYLALENKDVDIIDAFATDGLLKKFGLVVLEDAHGFFPPYYAIPVLSKDMAEKHPEAIPLLEKLGERLTTDVVTQLNYEVDELQRDPREVAVEFLKQEGFMEKK